VRLVYKLSLAPAVIAFGVACAGGPDPSAFRNRVFYDFDGTGGPDLAKAFETPYPPLDLEQAPPAIGYIGVEVLEGSVRLSRPKAWLIRRASNEPERRFIEYVSPNQLMFAVYERIESPREPWRVVMQRYEEEVEKSGGIVLGRPVPAATWNAQARAYDIERPVAAPKAPYVNYSREYLTRSGKRIVLIQMVHPSDSMKPVTGELMRVIQTLQVL
jgi:hypothetical protein